MASSSDKRSSRRINAGQFGAILAAIAILASLVGTLSAGLALPAVGAVGAIAKAVPATFEELPSDLEIIEPSEESRLLDSEGRVIARFYSERRTVVTSDQIAPIMKQAIVAIEDKRFYSHHGIDPDGMARALVNNLVGGSTQGASTITQQYVKNMLLQKGLQAGDQDLIDEATEITAERKLREMRYAIALESSMTKDEILTAYLNLAAFGSNIYGVEAASREYFSKSANELTAAEAALLAGTVQQPPLYDPLINPEISQARRDVVLGEMLELGYITQEEYDEAIATTVEEMLKPSNAINGCGGAGNAAYFCRYAAETFLQDEAFGADRAERQRLLNTGGLTLRTTLQRTAQDAAYQAVTDAVPVGDGSGLNVALVSTVPDSGYIVAMAQNTPYGVADADNPTATEVSFSADESHGGGTGFQTGSSFKIFTLVEWFYEGRSAYEKVGGSYSFPNGSFSCGGSSITTEYWAPGESDGAKRGTYSVIDATRLSVNQAFGDMATKVDFCQIFERAAAMGITDQNGETISPYPGNLLGSASTTPLELNTAFATLANNGTKCSPMALTEVEDNEGTIVKSYAPSCASVIDSTVAQQVTKVLETAYESNALTNIGRPYAGKSGTTDENASVWFTGYTPQLAASVWAGVASDPTRPGQSLMINGTHWDYLYGVTFAGPIWAQYMTQALADQPVEKFADVFIGNQPVTTPTTQTQTQQDTTQDTTNNQNQTDAQADQTNQAQNNG